jgi:hypothetical protein
MAVPHVSRKWIPGLAEGRNSHNEKPAQEIRGGLEKQ